MKRSLIIVTGHRTLESGGVGTHLTLLIDSLKRENVPFQVVLGRSAGDCLKAKILAKLSGCFYPAIRRVVHESCFAFGMARALERIVSRAPDQPWLVHAHDRMAVLGAYYLRKKRGCDIEIVETAHAPLTDGYRIAAPADHYLHDISSAWDRTAHAAARHIIAVDDLQRAIIESVYRDTPVTVIPNAVNLQELDLLRQAQSAEISAKRKAQSAEWTVDSAESSNTSRNGAQRNDGTVTQSAESRDQSAGSESLCTLRSALCTSGAPYLVIARHLTEKNGVPIAVKAFLQSKSSDKYRLLIIGEGADRPRIEQMIRDNNAGDKIQLLGMKPRHETLKRIAGASLSIVPSIPIHNYIEATSLTMLESMALGVPLIASNIGGLKDVLDGTGAAVMVPPNNVLALTRAIDSILNSPVLQAQLTEAALKIVRQYDTAAWIQKHINIYNACDVKRQA